MHRRFSPIGNIVVRNSDDGNFVIAEGYAAVFDSEAHNEVIRAGAFKKTLREAKEIFMLWNHDDNLPIASTANGTLELTEDEHGLRFSAKLDKEDDDAKRAAQKIKKRLVRGVSFGFDTIKRNPVDRSAKDLDTLSELLEVKLYEISPVTFPWYEAAEVSIASAHSLVGSGVDLTKLALAVETRDRSAFERQFCSIFGDSAIGAEIAPPELEPALTPSASNGRRRVQWLRKKLEKSA